ncbi:serine hydroxymethyltransferase [Saccharopolyspora indica]|uniref:serine hydroxymethyltransferase n=1 Tax=Saccharopolyspora indica TaxID=1229659 RepID=UPI0022EB0F74|nr:serine hydroxymethyltransferase [Saccharopolyspora indica]MDA3650032.1 serine hydroxymethyltransferase [Saccharopolyspora indica]
MLLANTSSVSRPEEADPELAAALRAESGPQDSVLVLASSASLLDPTALACLADPALQTASEDLPHRPAHAQLEALATTRAVQLFGARYADVRPDSPAAATTVVLDALLEPEDVVLDLRLAHGPHSALRRLSTHRWVGHGMGADGRLDHEEAAALAREHRPAVILCGAGSYPRHVDFARLRALAEEVDALLVADIAAGTGLVATGLAPSPVDHAHVTVASTHQQLGGPHGGLVLCGRDADLVLDGSARTLAERLRRAGGHATAAGRPATAAKARVLGHAGGPEFRVLAERILAGAAVLAEELVLRGRTLVSGGTDTQLCVLDLTGTDLTGALAERVLAEAGVVGTRCRVPADDPRDADCGGIALSSTVLAQRGFGDAEVREVAALVDEALRAVRTEDRGVLAVDGTVLAGVRAAARTLTRP